MTMWTATWSILLHLYHLPIILAEDTLYPDTCNYDYTGYMCGDSCTQQTILCSCGNTTLDYHSSQYCCTAPGDHCSKRRRIHPTSSATRFAPPAALWTRAPPATGSATTTTTAARSWGPLPTCRAGAGTRAWGWSTCAAASSAPRPRRSAELASGCGVGKSIHHHIG